MMIDKNYFLTRLANGEDMDAIGQEMAELMNAALAERNAQIEAAAAKKAEAEKAAYKRELVGEMVEIVQELAALEGFSGDEFEVTEEDMDQLVAAFTELFAAMRDLKKMFASIDTDKVRAATINVKPSDDQILADFIKMFN